jgi:hypothetical protein
MILLAAISLGAQESGPRYALVIGNGAYLSLKSLDNPVKDAMAVGAALQALGFSVTLKTNSDRKTINQAIVAFREALARDAQSEGVFYFAGHGIQSSKNVNYLIPVDASIKSESDLEDEAVRAQKVLDSLDESRNRVNLVIFDACRDNPLPATARSSGSRGLAVVSAAPPETIVLYSTAAGLTASDGAPGNGNSPFTAALIKFLAEPGDITRTIKLVTGEVKATTPDRQTPFVYSNLSKDFFLNRGTGPVAPQSASAPPSMTLSPAPAGPTFTVTRSYGSLILTAATDGALYLDGRLLGDLPAGAEARLDNIEVGSRNLELRYSGGEKETRMVSVQKGQVSSLSFGWKQAAEPAATALAAASAPKVYKIGDTGPAGGLVFYDKGGYSEGWRYLEAAPSDQSPGISWYNGSYIYTGADSPGSGRGKSNTRATILKQGAGNYAASLCEGLVLGGFDDWFLPSKDELNLMYTNLKKAGLGGFGSDWYWSSTQISTNPTAWGQNFGDGRQLTNYRNEKSRVRAARAF